MPIGTYDRTPPLVALDAGGQLIPAGATVTLVPALAGRVLVTVLNLGSAGRLWLGFDGVAAQENVGIAIDASGYWQENSSGAVSVHNSGSAAVLATYQGWAA